MDPLRHAGDGWRLSPHPRYLHGNSAHCTAEASAAAATETDALGFFERGNGVGWDGIERAVSPPPDTGCAMYHREIVVVWGGIAQHGTNVSPLLLADVIILSTSIYLYNVRSTT